MTRLRSVSLSALILSLCPVLASAQQAREGPAVLGVGGIVYQKAVFGDDNPKANQAVGPTLGVQLRGPRSGATAFTLEAMLQPNAVVNPHYEEHFAPGYIMIGGQTGRRTYVRWSGGVTSIGGIAPMLGIALGIDRHVGPKYLAGAEFVVRAAGVYGAAGVMAGVQVPIGVRSAR